MKHKDGCCRLSPAAFFYTFAALAESPVQHCKAGLQKNITTLKSQLSGRQARGGM